MHPRNKKLFKRLFKATIVYIVYLIIICALVVNHFNQEEIKKPLAENKNVVETESKKPMYTQYILNSKANSALLLNKGNSTDVYTTINLINKETQNEEISKEEIVESKNDYTIIKTYDVPTGHSFKSYTNYKMLSETSKQGELQKTAYTGDTGIRMVDDYYCAALGTYYEGQIGDKYLVTLSTGNQFKMILCDVKDDRHTDANHQYTKTNGCVIEFYVDYSVLDSNVKRMGNISYIDGFEGEIIQIQKIQ